MTAQTAGIPLNTGEILRNDGLQHEANQQGKYKYFLPGSYTLGEILAKEGYSNYLLIGSDSNFGGRSNYFSQHGNYTIHDYNYAIEQHKIPSNYHVFWGYEDRKLYQFAREELTKIAQTNKPFNYTILTVDTHFTDGFLDEQCPKNYARQYDNVYRCASLMINEFLEWAKMQDWYDNTTIVISGDHLGMQIPYYQQLIGEREYHRTIYNAFINSVISPIKSSNRQFTSVDMYPSTLAAMGVKIEGERLGLGVNLFSNQPTMLEQYGDLNKLNEDIAKRNRIYNDKIRR